MRVMCALLCGFACLVAFGIADPCVGADTSPPSTPVVTDDGTYTANATALHASWTSTDAQSGIAEYQYQIRQDSTSGLVVVNWTSTGTARDVTRTGLTLANGKRYYIGVKARNGAGLWSPLGFSNGIVVDASLPSAPGRPIANGTAGFVYDADGRYTVSWTAATDVESTIAAYELQERRGWMAAWTTLSSSLTSLAFAVPDRPHGAFFEYQVRARNHAGLWGPFSAISDLVVVDKTAPFPPQALDNAAFTSSTTTLEVTWSASDPESPVVEYRYEIRRDSPTGGAIVGWTSAAMQPGVTRTGLKLLHGVTYFVNVKARNAAGLWSATGSTNGVQVDATPPTRPVVTDDGATTDSLTTLHAHWTASVDPESGVWGYDLAIGTTPGGTDTRGWTDVGSARESTQTGLALVPGVTYYVSVRGRNLPGAVSAAGTSDGIRVNVPVVPDGSSVVTASGRQLVVRKRLQDGSLGPAAPYTIRGVVWSPASPDTATGPFDPHNADVRRSEFGKWYATDIPMMKAMHVNTVRLYIDPGVDPELGPIGRAVLDELYRNDIMVIMTVDDAINDTSRAQQVVSFYKDHPAVLMWSLGNEWNINLYYGVASSVPDAAQRTETAAQLVAALDSNHPVASSYGEIDISADGLRLADTATYVNDVVTSAGIWSLNIYRGWTFGTLWSQWAQISTKPMFVGEFGIDAFQTTAGSDPPAGTVNELAQADWDGHLWDDIARNLSSTDPERVALGGTVFGWNDEWWKVAPPGQQDTGGWQSGAFPDRFGNEEYFGLVDIHRMPRRAYQALAARFDPAYTPPPRTMELRAESSGGSSGRARFLVDRHVIYDKAGGGAGGRGFNVSVIDRITGTVVEAGLNFDTYSDQTTGAAMEALIDYLANIPDGRIVMLAIGDEAGLTRSTPACEHLPYPWVESGLQALESLGSSQIRSYCFRGGWAMITLKGSGSALDEALSSFSPDPVAAQEEVPVGP